MRPKNFVVIVGLELATDMIAARTFFLATKSLGSVATFALFLCKLPNADLRFFLILNNGRIVY